MNEPKQQPMADRLQPPHMQPADPTPSQQHNRGRRDNPHTHPGDLESDRGQDRAKPLPG